MQVSATERIRLSAKLKAHYEAGKSTQEVAYAINRSYSFARNLLREAGVEFRPARRRPKLWAKPTPELILAARMALDEKLKRLYLEEGRTVAAVAREVRIPVAVAEELLEANGVTLRLCDRTV